MKLASIEKVEKIVKHPNADKLSIVTVAGYECITQLDQYKVGELVVFIQPDTVLPDAPWAKFYKEKYNRVKAIKLRGVYSMGIVESIWNVYGKAVNSYNVNTNTFNISLGGLASWTPKEGDDIAVNIGVTKYVSPGQAAQEQAEAETNKVKTFGNSIKNKHLRKLYWITIGKVAQKLARPKTHGFNELGIPKTDEERWQGIKQTIPFGEVVDVTEKIEGQSCSFFRYAKVRFKLWNFEWKYSTYGVLGRSIQHKITNVHPNDYVKMWEKYSIKNKLEAYCSKHKVNICIRGESYGGKIQNFKINPRAGVENQWMMFSVWLIDEKRYARKGDKHYFVNVAREMGVPYVPILEENVVLTEELIKKYDTDLTELNGKTFEGVVINHKNITFKVINKSYDSMK